MSDKNDGGNAFPHSHEWNPSYSGMTLRDYFAIRLGQALLTTENLFQINGENATRTPKNIAEAAYAYADAMLKARDEK
jgi:hypothetical protein